MCVSYHNPMNYHSCYKSEMNLSNCRVCESLIHDQKDTWVMIWSAGHGWSQRALSHRQCRSSAVERSAGLAYHRCRHAWAAELSSALFSMFQHRSAHPLMPQRERHSSPSRHVPPPHVPLPHVTFQRAPLV